MNTLLMERSAKRMKKLAERRAMKNREKEIWSRK